MLAALALGLAIGGSEPPPFHAVAFVNDPLSHGTVGDGLLSLNEAIRLHNGTLLMAALSPQEVAQLSQIPGTGGTTDVTWIDIDGGNTPVITIEQNLDPVLNSPFGLLIKGFGEQPVLDFSGAGITEGLYAPTNALTLEDLTFYGGPYGVRCVQTDVTGQPGCVLQDVRFEGQAQYGLRVTATTAGGVGRVIVDGCDFVQVPNAIELSDTGAGRNTIVELRSTTILGGVHALQAAVGTGGTGRFTLDRLVIDQAVEGIALQLPTTNGKALLIEGNHVRVRAQVCFLSTAAVDTPTWLQCGAWTLSALPPGNVALQLGAAGSQVFGDLNECSFAGDVLVGVGGAQQPLVIRNPRCRDGDVSIATSATQQVVVREGRFDDCDVDTPGPGVITFEDCCFAGGSVGANAPAGTMSLVRCFAPNAGAGTVASLPLPAEQLGRVVVTPDDVAVGSAIQLGVDLPAGLAALLVLGEAADLVVPLPAPFYAYVDLGQFVILPGIYRFQQAFTWNVPNLVQFVGLDFVAQAVVLPDPGVQAPALQLPPGWRFVLQ